MGNCNITDKKDALEGSGKLNYTIKSSLFIILNSLKYWGKEDSAKFGRWEGEKTKPYLL